jgi:hypothetical protein
MRRDPNKPLGLVTLLWARLRLWLVRLRAAR